MFRNALDLAHPSDRNQCVAYKTTPNGKGNTTKIRMSQVVTHDNSIKYIPDTHTHTHLYCASFRFMNRGQSYFFGNLQLDMHWRRQQFIHMKSHSIFRKTTTEFLRTKSELYILVGWRVALAARLFVSGALTLFYWFSAVDLNSWLY